MVFFWMGVGVVTLLVCLLVALLARGRSKDEIFVGITPGQVPAAGSNPPVEHVRSRSGEYAGECPVQFQPPRDLAPGLVGTIVDGRAEMRDVTATIVDLAVRGFLKIETTDPEETLDQNAAAGAQGPKNRGRSGGRGKAKQDWILIAQPHPNTPLQPFEGRLLSELFSRGPRVRMSDLQANAGKAMREAQVSLYRQVVDRKWYPKHPLAGGGRLRIVGGVLIAIGVVLLVLAGLALFAPRPGNPLSLVGGAGIALGGLVLLLTGRRTRVGRTALGTAMMIQSRGFKEYLATAEADQIRFEEASTIFSRYLPYAIVFGVADHWAKVFGEVARRYRETHQFDGVDVADAMFDLMWFDMMFDGHLDLFGALDISALGDAFGGLDMADPGEVLSGFTDSVGGFVDSAADFDLPGCAGMDGCDGFDALDGCDVGGCDL